MKPRRFWTVFCLVLASVLGSFFFLQGLSEAGRGGSFGSSRSFSGSRSSGFGKNSSWSPRTVDTWSRNGGGVIGSGKTDSSGYSKPSAPQSPSPSSGYSKPGGVGSTETGGASSSGYSKPVSKPQESSGQYGSKPSQGGSGYSKPVGPSPDGSRFSGGSKFDKETIQAEKKKRSLESLERYKAEQTKFKKPEVAVDGSQSSPLADKAKVYSGFDYGTHYSSWDNYYKSMGYQPPPYAFNSAPSFGMFDTIFLFWMLDHVTNKNVAATAYNHSNDPGFQKWRQEVENQAKDNAELKAKLGEMDKQIKALEGTPKDPAYLPSGVPAEAALAASVLAVKKPEKPVIRFASGQKGGWYDKVAAMIKNKEGAFDVKTIPTSGSLENLKLLTSGKADLGVVQSDVLFMVDKKLPGNNLISEQSTLYKEFVQIIANRDSAIKSLKDIDPSKNVVYVGPKDSGTALTWEALGEHNEELRKVPVNYGDYSAALSEVQKNPKALMMFVGGLNSDLLKKAEELAKKSGKLRLVAVDDANLLNVRDKHGNPVYAQASIGSNVYHNLQKGWFFSDDVKTLAVKAVLVLRTDWAKDFGPEAMDSLSLAVNQITPMVEKLVNGQ